MESLHTAGSGPWNGDERHTNGLAHGATLLYFTLLIANFSAPSATALCGVRAVEQARLNLPLWLSGVLQKQQPSDIYSRELSGSIIAGDASVSVGMGRPGWGSVGWEGRAPATKCKTVRQRRSTCRSSAAAVAASRRRHIAGLSIVALQGKRWERASGDMHVA